MESSSGGENRKPAPQQPDMRNWKLIHDPFLKKGYPKLYRYNGVVPENSSFNVHHLSDPRILSSKLLSRNEPIDLPIPTFTIDANYVGRPALRELAFFDLNDNVSENFLTDMCKKCGKLEEVKVFSHPTTKRRLGVARVVFQTEKEASACLERYNGTSIMGSIVRVITDPWGKKVNEAVDQRTNKNQSSSLQDQPKTREDEGTPSAAAAAASSSSKTYPKASQRTPANASSSPAIPTPGVNGAVPDDPSSQTYIGGVPAYGAMATYAAPPPPPMYPMPGWPPQAGQIPPPPPPHWVQGVTPWVPPPWPMHMPPNYAPPPPVIPPQQHVSDIALPPGTEPTTMTTKEEAKKKEENSSRKRSRSPGKTSKEQKSRPKDGGGRPASRTDSRSSSRADRKSSASRPSSRLDHRSGGNRSRSRSKSERSLSTGRRRSTLSPDPHRSHRPSSRSRNNNENRSQRHHWPDEGRRRGRSPVRTTTSDRYKRRYEDGKGVRSQDGGRSRSPKRSRRRSSESTESSPDSRRKRRPRNKSVVESVDEEEEYYRRSKTSSQQRDRRPTSRASNGDVAASKSVIGKDLLESRKSGGSEYCDEIEEYEYYRKQRRRRIVPSKGHQSSSKTSNNERQLEHKFEAITSSDEDEGAKKSHHGRPSSSASNLRNEISPPFGKLERISCSSDDGSDKEHRRGKDTRRKETRISSNRRTTSRNSNERRYKRARSASSSDSRSASSDSRNGRRRDSHHRRYQKKQEDRAKEKYKTSQRSPTKKEKLDVSKTSAAAAPAFGSLESRIQQLLASDPSQAGKTVDERCSTPLQDEQNVSAVAVKAERTSDMEMDLSSGDEDQSPATGSAPPASVPVPVASTTAAYPPAAMPPHPGYYQPQMYMYPPMGAGYMGHAMIPPPPGYASMWPPPPYPGMPYQPTQAPPVSSTPELPHAKPKSTAKAPSAEQVRKRIISQSVFEVRAALKTVLQKDIVKRAVETAAFQSIDSWYAKEEVEYTTSTKESENDSSKRLSAMSTVTSSIPQTLSLTTLFESRTAELGPSLLTGVPGLGLRASLPKLPSFKRKIVRPMTPPSPSRDDRSRSSRRTSSSSSSESSSESSSASSDSEEEEEKSKASSDQVSTRGRNRKRSRALSTDRSRSRSATVDSEPEAIQASQNASSRAIISSDDEEEEEDEKATKVDTEDERERRMEPISEDEIEDDNERLVAEESKTPLEKDEDESETKAKNRIDSDHENETKTVQEKPSPLVTQNKISPPKGPAKRGRGRRGRPARVETTTEDECSGQENAEAVSKELQPQPSNEPVEPPRPIVERPDGAMFVEEGSRYLPNEFDHHYTLRMGHAPPSTASSSAATPATTAVLKTIQTTSLAEPKPKPTPKEVKPSKPARPAVTFKPRIQEDESRILYEFLQAGIDEEDIGYTKMVYDQWAPQMPGSPYWKWAHHVATSEPPFKKRRLPPDEIPAHSTGCARTQGFYRLSHKEKRVKARARQALEYTEAQNQQIVNMAKQQVQISREARSMQRRLLATLGSEVDSDLLKYNQLKFRKKHIKFSRSHIHGWGLFAMEDIAQDEMIVEYVGEKIRITVAEKREKKYEKMGVGSSYLFRIDNDMVVDATKRGNIARFINHSCNPNCYARIITVEGEKRIVIYSKQNISCGEEITYDYKFPLEDEKIPCHCGASCCRGYLN